MVIRYFRKNKNVYTDNIRVCKSVKDVRNEEYFVKKAEAARQSIEKWGLPKELLVGKR